MRLLLLFLLSIQTLFSSSKPRMDAEIDFINNFFKETYAPMDWKAKYCHLNLDQEAEIAKSNILEEMDLKSFQYILKNFLKKTQDYHVAVVFHATEFAYLPLQIKGVQTKEGNYRYFLSFIHRDQLSKHYFPFFIGDEVISIDDQPIDQIIKELKNPYSKENEKTEQSRAERKLCLRQADLGDRVPRGDCKITLKKNGRERSVYIAWNYFSEGVKAPLYTKELAQKLSSKVESSLTKNPKDYLMAPIDCLKQQILLSNSGLSDHKQLNFSNKIWQSDKEGLFYSYIFETNDFKRVGYLKVEDYIGDGAKKVQELQELVLILQENSDILIIDQRGNPGGYVFYAYAFASMFTDKPLITPKQRFKITQKEVFEALENEDILSLIRSDSDAVWVCGKEWGGYPVDYQFSQNLLQFYRFLIYEWDQGKQFTDPTHFFAVDKIHPYPGNLYTKPIIMLIDEQDFSCADFIPAIFQDNQRAHLFGEKTAGAGGCVARLSYPNLLGIESISYTISLAKRIDGQPIENLGVQPDTVCPWTIEDIQEDGRAYKKALLNKIHELIR